MKNSESKDLLIQKLVKKNMSVDKKDFPCVTLCLKVCRSCLVIG